MKHHNRLFGDWEPLTTVEAAQLELLIAKSSVEVFGAINTFLNNKGCTLEIGMLANPSSEEVSH